MNYLATWLPFWQISLKTLAVMESINFLIFAGLSATNAALIIALNISFDVNWRQSA